MRWSQAYKARTDHRDTMDTLGAQAPEPGQSVKSVKSVIGAKNDNATQPPPGDAPFIDDPVERAATEAEHLPVRNVRKRNVSWTPSSDEPAPGDYCACCGSHLWWTETTAPKGWRCTRCHPPAHLEAGGFRAVAT
jgi:hypothetical protein